MFENIGKKIKTTATTLCWLGIIASTLVGISLISNSEATFLGLVIILGGSLLSWMSSFLLYGFGQLIENSDNLARYAKETQEKAIESPIEKPIERPIASNVSCQKSTPNLDLLDILRDEQVITEEEYIRRKKRALQSQHL